MDADLSHSPNAIPRMIAKLKEGADFVLGSRYVEGGSTSDKWGFLRWLNSRVAMVLTRPITSVRDPMAGFFAIRRSTFEGGRDFNPVGYKIALELMLRCGCERVVEVPIQFDERRFGQRKLTLRQQLLFLRHLRRLYIFKYGVWSQLTQFLLVGGLGTIVNLSFLTMLIATGLPTQAGVALAILISMCFNFVLNRRFSFPQARRGSWRRQLLAFVGAMSVGSTINYGVTLWLMSRFPSVRPQAAALAGIAIGTLSNFVASRYLVFRMSHIRPVHE
jgi:dolichol-phosphate mannosyltransferase